MLRCNLRLYRATQNYTVACGPLSSRSLLIVLAAQGLRVVCVKPGFVKTSMTQGLKPPPFAGEPEDVARDVLRAIDRGTPIVYTPGMWRWVMLVIRNLPRFVMRRIGF